MKARLTEKIESGQEEINAAKYENDRSNIHHAVQEAKASVHVYENK